jgi:hypothetical protein
MSGERGFLTRTDREFLAGEKEYTGENAKQQRYERRRAIRERTRQAFSDFQFLLQNLDAEERNKIFGPPAEEAPELENALIDTVAFLYHALEGDAGSNAVDWEQSVRVPFRFILEAGVRQGEIRRQEANNDHQFLGNPKVTFEVDVQRLPTVDTSRVVDDLAENYGRGVSDEQLRAVIVQAVRDTLSSGEEPTVRGEPLEEALDDYHGTDLRALADRIEQRAAELEEE